MTIVPTFTATIYVGLRVGRTGDPNFELHSVADALEIIHTYIDADGWCVTVTPTEFHYKNGWEPGVMVGIIHYARFPATPCELRERTMELADRLRKGLRQHRVSVVMPQETVMLGEDEHGAPQP